MASITASMVLTTAQETARRLFQLRVRKSGKERTQSRAAGLAHGGGPTIHERDAGRIAGAVAHSSIGIAPRSLIAPAIERRSAADRELRRKTEPHSPHSAFAPWLTVH
jgi:hypothetical protein